MTHKIKQVGITLLAGAVFAVACSPNDDRIDNPTEPGEGSRWITIAGALMGTDPGDGNGGTMVYAISAEDAENPEVSVNVYDEGFHVRSQRTARLQSTEDGSTLFNIAYTGPNGGEFSTYEVKGGDRFEESDVKVNISHYASAAPRWLKLFNGDRTGIAVNVSNVQIHEEDDAYQYARGLSTVLALDLQNAVIENYKQYELSLSTDEEAEGHYIFRLDGAVLNKAGNHLIIGIGKRKYDPETGLLDETDFEKISAKSLIVDYPSLENPRIISSNVSVGNTNGYRSFNAFLAEDGYIYQATQQDEEGSRLIRIDPNNEYDDAYNFSLDEALKLQDSYIDAWRYVGGGVALVTYTYGEDNPGYVAKVNLLDKTAEQIDLPYDSDLDFGQYQGFVVEGDWVYLAVTPTGKDGNIYLVNHRTGAVKKGAKLVNKPGNHYIGVF